MGRVLARGRVTLVVGRSESAREFVDVVGLAMICSNDPSKFANIVLRSLSTDGRRSRTAVSFDVSIEAQDGNAVSDLARRAIAIERAWVEVGSGRRSYGRILHDGVVSTYDSIVTTPIEKVVEQDVSAVVGRWVES